MEELRSTEALEREVLEDARKKARRILKSAEEMLASQEREWEEKTRSALETARKAYAERTARKREEIIARLPLDKRRARSETAESLLLEAMDEFLSALSRKELLKILEKELALRIGVLAEEGALALAENKEQRTENRGLLPTPYYLRFLALLPTVHFSGMDASEAALILKRVAAKWPDILPISELLTDIMSTDKKINESHADKINGMHEFPSIVIDLQCARVTASVESSSAELLKNKRSELASALLGKEILDD